MRRASQPPLGVRLIYGLRPEPDYGTISDEELVEIGRAQNRVVSAPAARLITGLPTRGVHRNWVRVPLPGRAVPVRVHRPRRTSSGPLPLVLHVHGGGFTGTALQCDWLTSHLAARLPAVVASVEHRLLGPGTPMSAAVADVSGVLEQITADAAGWGVDPDQVALVGESAGGTMTALVAQQAHRRPPLAQVLVNPCLDLTDSALTYPSMTAHARTPTVSADEVERFCRLAAPPGTDARAASPMHTLTGDRHPPTLLVIPALDPLADQARTYAQHLRQTGTPVDLAEYPRAGHAFLSMPHLVPSARPARSAVRAFLTGALGAVPGPARD